jgi:hypothetical protein
MASGVAKMALFLNGGLIQLEVAQCCPAFLLMFRLRVELLSENDHASTLPHSPTCLTLLCNTFFLSSVAQIECLSAEIRTWTANSVCK